MKPETLNTVLWVIQIAALVYFLVVMNWDTKECIKKLRDFDKNKSNGDIKISVKGYKLLQFLKKRRNKQMEKIFKKALEEEI